MKTTTKTATKTTVKTTAKAASKQTTVKTTAKRGAKSAAKSAADVNAKIGKTISKVKEYVDAVLHGHVSAPTTKKPSTKKPVKTAKSPASAKSAKTTKTTTLRYSIASTGICRIRDIDIKNVARINDKIVTAVTESLRGFRAEHNKRGNANTSLSLTVSNEIADDVKLMVLRNMEPRTIDALVAHLKSVIRATFRKYKADNVARAAKKAEKEAQAARAAKLEAKKAEKKPAVKSAPTIVSDRDLRKINIGKTRITKAQPKTTAAKAAPAKRSIKTKRTSKKTAK